MTSIRPDGPMEQGEWDDNRLETAFAARAAMAPSTPPDIAAEVLARLTPSRRALPPWPTFAVAAAAVALVVVLGASTILKQLTPSPSGANGAASGPLSGSAGTYNPVLDALGAPISVSAALAVRASGQPGRELVVAGFLSPFRALPCAYMPGPDNPTFLRCPATMQWLMEQPEDVWTVSPNELDGQPPIGPALHPSFALLDQPAMATGDEREPPVVPAVLIGHFDDRRAALCDAPNREACSQTFMVDRVLSLNGMDQPVGTSRSSGSPAADFAEDVDALVTGVAPNAIVESRQLLELGQVFSIEPILRQDPILSAWSDQTARVWLVTAVDVIDGRPAARTFALLDGVSWFAEVTADGAQMLDRTAPAASGPAEPVTPTADPTAFESAPTSVLGVDVRTIGSVEAERATTMDELGRDELALRAWYVAPDPAATCAEQLPAIHPPTPPCDEGRHWLLDDPRQYGVEPGQLRRDPSTDQYPPVLNPLLPVDVAFDVGSTWNGETPTPRPVVVLGHFNDSRVQAFHGDVYFVIDALAWTFGGPVGSLDRVSRLTHVPTDAAAPIARVDAVSSSPALATWATVIDSSDFASLDPYVAEQAGDEFTTGPPVWIIRRLVERGYARPYAVVEIGFTAEGGSRVWWAESDSSDVDLMTSDELHDVDANTPLVHVFDYGRAISSVSPALHLESPVWQELRPVPDFIEVARGQSSREVAVRWQGPACAGWRLNVRSSQDSFILEPRPDDASCDGDLVKHTVVIAFDRPVDLDAFRTEDPCCG